MAKDINPLLASIRAESEKAKTERRQRAAQILSDAGRSTGVRTPYASVLGESKGYTPYADAMADNRDAGFWEKVKGITAGVVGGAARGYAADFENAGATLQEMRNQERSFLPAWMRESATERVSGQNLVNADLLKNLMGAKTTPELETDLRQATGNVISQVQEHSDEQAEKAQLATQKAQSYTGTLGDMLIEAGTSQLQSFADMGAGRLLGFGGRPVMALRTFGAGAREARQEGASIDQQVMAGLANAGVEVGTEALSGGVLKQYGGGAADDVTEALIGSVTKNNTVRTILRFLANAHNEGVEEGVAELLNPLVRTIYNDKGVLENYADLNMEDVVHSYLVGVLSGGIGESIGAVTGQQRSANELLEDRVVKNALEDLRTTAKDQGIFTAATRQAVQRAAGAVNDVQAEREAAAKAKLSLEDYRTLREAVEESERRQDETIKKAAGETAEQGGAYETISDGGEGNGDAGVSAGRPAGVFPEAAGGPEADEQGNRREGGQSAGAAESPILREVSPAELGVIGGDTERRVQILDTERAGGSVAEAAEAVRSIGMEPVAYRGQMRVHGAPVNGYIENGRIYFRTDAVGSSGETVDPRKIVEHEMFHAAAEADPEIVDTVRDTVREKMSEEEFRRVSELYKKAYSKIQDFSDWTEEEIAEYLAHEIAADAYAGINYFNDAPAIVEAARAAAPQVGQAQTIQGAAEARGPPVGRATINADDGTYEVLKGEDGEYYVKRLADGKIGDPRGNIYILANSIASLKDMKPVAHLTGTELNESGKPASQQIKEFFDKRGNRVFREDFGEVILDAYGAKGSSTKAHHPTRAKIMAVAAVPEVIQKGRQISYQVKDNGMKSYIFAAPVDMMGKPIYVAAVVNVVTETRDGNNTKKYYLDEVVDAEGFRFNVQKENSDTTKADLLTNREDSGGSKFSSKNTVPQTEAESNRNLPRASVEVPGEQLTPQERKLVNDRIVMLNRGGKKVEVEIRRADTGQWFFSVRSVGGKPVYDETPHSTPQEAARAALELAEQYAMPESTRAQNALNEAADEAAEAGVEPEEPPKIGRYSRKEWELEQDRIRTLVENEPWGAGARPLNEDLEGQAEADKFAEERDEKNSREIIEDMESYDELLRKQLPVKTDEGEKVTSNVERVKPKFRERLRQWFQSMMRTVINTGDTIHRIGREVGNKALDGYYFRALASRQTGTEWITGKRHDILGRVTGKGLNEIFDPIREKGDDYYRKFQMFLFHRLNVERMSREYETEIREAREEVERLERVEPGLSKLADEDLKRIADGFSMDAQLARDYREAKRRREKALQRKNKPVFGPEVTAEDSKAAAQRLLAENPEFEELAKDVYDYCDALLQYRVDAGLMTQKDKENLQRIYPHYVPTFRATDKEESRILHKGGLRISKAIGRAVGGDEVLLPLHVSLARQTMTVTKNAAINRLGLALLETRDKNKEAMSQYITKVKEAEAGFSENDFDEEEVEEPRKKNVITVIEDGKRYDLTLDEGLTDAFEAFEPDKWAGKPLAEAGKGMVELFKKLTTAYNPIFLARNAVRDFQDAGLYSVDFKTWLKNFPKVYDEMWNNGKYWQMYKGLGGNYASFFDYATGEARTDDSGIKGRVEKWNRFVEAAPRLAEFMTVLQKTEARNGMITEADLMEAFEAAQDVTTNFGRSGSLTKMANKYLVPFLNPSIQGADKFFRTMFGQKGGKAWAQMVIRSAALSIAPALINGLLYRDDEEWEDITDATKANYYLFKLGKGIWLKIPKGRAIATLSAAAVAGQEALRGDEINPADYLEIISTNIAPQNPLEANVLRAWFDAALFRKDNPGTTWYGGNIESERMQSYRPGERFDESTDYISRFLGKTFDLSPAKINYLIDQYSGVFGDLLLPSLTPQAETGPLSKAFTVDVVRSNETTGKYYDTLDELKWDMNGGDIAAGVTYRYMQKAGGAVSEYYAQVREIENDRTLTSREKKKLIRELYRGITTYQKEILDTGEKYRLAAEEYFDEHPELDYEDGEAVKAYMEQYNAEQSEGYKKNETQTAALMEAIVYREVNRAVLGAEYALETYSGDVYEKAQKANEDAGVPYEVYYDYYFGTKDLHADRDENGKSISGTKKAKVLGFIAAMEIPDEQKDALAIAAGYKTGSWKAYTDGETNGKTGGGSGGKGRKKSGKPVKIKDILTKPVGVSYDRSMSIEARSAAPSAYEDIRQVTQGLRKKNPWYALPTGNPELDEERPAAARYFATGRF